MPQRGVAVTDIMESALQDDSFTYRLLDGRAGTRVAIAAHNSVVIVVIEVDQGEHERRRELGIGALTDRRSLHVLWAMPQEERVHVDTVPPEDLCTLERLRPSFVDQIGKCYVRSFQPAARVLGCIGNGKTAESAVKRLSQVPPIFTRVAVSGRLTEGAAASALRRRVGLAKPASGGWVVQAEAPPPVLGVPSVYRWWIAEQAYDAWIKPTAPIEPIEFVVQ